MKGMPHHDICGLDFENMLYIFSYFNSYVKIFSGKKNCEH